jgi:hypothetical protein
LKPKTMFGAQSFREPSYHFSVVKVLPNGGGVYHASKPLSNLGT